MRRLLLLAALLGSLAAPIALGQTEPDTLRGTITDPAGAPLDSAIVTVADWPSDTTGADGRYEVRGFPATTVDDGVPDRRFSFEGVYPNPLSSRFQFCADITEPSELEMRVFDMLGRRVYESAKAVAAGRLCEVVDLGVLPDGVYAFQLRVGDDVATRKITHLQSAPSTAGAPSTSDSASGQTRGADLRGEAVEITVARPGYEDIAVSEELPDDGVRDFEMAYDENKQYMVVRTGSYPVSDAHLAWDFDGDGTPDAEGSTDEAGRGVVLAPYRGPSVFTVQKAGYTDTVIEDFFFGAPSYTVDLGAHLPFQASALVTHQGAGLEGVLVTAACTLHGEEYTTSDVTDASGVADLSLSFDGLRRGGSYALPCVLTTEADSFYDRDVSLDLEHGSTVELPVVSHPSFVINSVSAVQWDEALAGEVLVEGVEVFDENRQIIPSGAVSMDADGRVFFYAEVALDASTDMFVKPSADGFTEGFAAWHGAVGAMSHPYEGRLIFTWRHEPRPLTVAADSLIASSESGEPIEISAYVLPNHVYESGLLRNHFRFKTGADPDLADWTEETYTAPGDVYSSRRFDIKPVTLVVNDVPYTPSEELGQLIDVARDRIVYEVIGEGTNWDLSWSRLPLDSPDFAYQRYQVWPGGDLGGTNSTVDLEDGVLQWGQLTFNSLVLPSDRDVISEMYEGMFNVQSTSGTDFFLTDGNGVPQPFQSTYDQTAFNLAFGANSTWTAKPDFSRFD